MPKQDSISERLVSVIRDLSFARTLEAVMAVVRRNARELTGADGATFVLRDDGCCYYADEDAIEPLWKGKRFPMSACISGWAMLNARAAVIEDIYADPRIPADAYRPTFVKSLAMMPVRAKDPIAAVGVYWARRHLATEQEVVALQAIADATAVALDNVRLYEDLTREREAAVAQAQAMKLLYEKAQQEMAAREKLEGQLRQAQKMEAVGRFAGGVAHDFNNVLTAILGYSELGLLKLADADPVKGDMLEIRKAAQRAASLTRQILAFSRRQALQPAVLDLNEVVVDMERMLRRLIGEDVELSTRCAPDLGRVRADRGQLEQVLMNLVVNARDAMPRGGKLAIETGNVALDEQYAREHPEARPGPHVQLAVSDTGHGMDKETLSRLFEPFFTTKEPGRGTGLGLSTVYGIVRQNGGTIWVYSEVGRGTTFKVYLPRVEESKEAAPSAAPTKSGARGTETVLVVEDQDMVRAFVTTLLRAQGYRVFEARRGPEALEAAGKHPGPVHLLLTDVVMPEMNGRELAAHLRRLRPEIRVLYFSGYTDQAAASSGLVESGVDFLEKPFTPEALTTKVRAVLDAPRKP